MTGLVGMGAVSAQNQANDQPPSIVRKHAERFHLNENDVQKVFDEHRAEHKAEHKQRLQERLQQAVKDGKLTQEQADKLTAKLDEMESLHESLKDKTTEERHAVLEIRHEEMKQWLKDNNIPEEYWRFGGHRKHAEKKPGAGVHVEDEHTSGTN